MDFIQVVSTVRRVFDQLSGYISSSEQWICFLLFELECEVFGLMFCRFNGRSVMFFLLFEKVWFDDLTLVKHTVLYKHSSISQMLETCPLHQMVALTCRGKWLHVGGEAVRNSSHSWIVLATLLINVQGDGKDSTVQDCTSGVQCDVEFGMYSMGVLVWSRIKTIRPIQCLLPLNYM